MSSTRRSRKTPCLVALLFLLSFSPGGFCGRGGSARRYDDNTAKDASSAVRRSTEEQIAALEEADGFDFTSAEWDRQPQHDEDWNRRPNIICHADAPCKCLKTHPRKIECRQQPLKDGRLLDTAFLMLADNGKFDAEIVDLSYNEIQLLRKNYILPNEAQSLVVLDASHNWIADVEAYAFENFPKLAVLKLSDNRLGDSELSDDWLTKKLGQTLHQLYLDYNYFERIDDGIFDNLVNLRKLVLDGNLGIELTRHTFGPTLTELKTISLDYCGIETLDEDTFRKLPNLQQLSLAGNPITDIVPALRYIPKLSVISMSETLLEVLPKHAFKYNPELKNVYMRRMRYLTEVASCAFCGLPNIEVIDFTNSTHLERIDKNAFGGTSDQDVLPMRIDELQLANCNLTSVDQHLVRWKSLRKFGAANNRWHCDCSFFWLLDDRDLHKFVGETPVCASPPELQDETLFRVREKMSCFGRSANTENTNESGGISGLTIGFMFVVAAAIVVVGGVMFTQRHGGASEVIQRVRDALPSRNQEVPFGYADLDRGSLGAAATEGAVVVGANIDDFNDAPDARLDDDFNRPEFV